MKFEYKIIDHRVEVGLLGGHKLGELEKLLDGEGAYGWEAVGYTYRATTKEAFHTILLKREKLR